MFAEVRRVLHPSGTCFVNLGDSYFTGATEDGPAISSNDAAWLAALIDGEGCIQVHKQVRDSGSPSYQLDVSVGMMDADMVEYAHRVTGLGTVSLQNRGVWDWSVRGQQASMLLRVIYPWLLIKKRQANIGVMLCEDLVEKRGHRVRPLTQDTLEYRERLRVACSECNQRRDAGIEIRVLKRIPTGLSVKPKSLLLAPFRFALAMQADGWILRDVIVWHKPAPMPESVRDRCTKAWEPIFMFAKSPRYFADMEGVKTPAATRADGTSRAGECSPLMGASKHRTEFTADDPSYRGGHEQDGRPVTTPTMSNLRNVWKLSPEAYKGKHFATFPSELPRRCIKIGTSERGACPRCLAPWTRVVKRKRVATRPGTNWKGAQEGSPLNEQTAGYLNVDPQRHCTTTETTGWQPTCQCNAGDPVPCVVLDPFCGSGTTMKVAAELGRDGIGLDLSTEYRALAVERIGPLNILQQREEVAA